MKRSDEIVQEPPERNAVSRGDLESYSRKMRILFLSGLDLKQKSIQVIHKTPEAYARRGCYVKYIVSRDTSIRGDYYYEDVINPPGIEVVRVHFESLVIRQTFGPCVAL